MFLKSRREGTSSKTILFYKQPLCRAIPILGLTPTPRQINRYLDSLPCSSGGKHAYYRAISVFYNWLYSPRSGFNFVPYQNPIAIIDSPHRPKLILPSLTKEQIELLIEKARCVRDKAIITLFAESGLRLSELLNIKTGDIDLESHTMKVLGKGKKEGYAPFGNLTGQYLRLWLNEYQPEPNGRIWDIGFWGINRRGIQTVLKNLEQHTGIKFNPHSFRRGFACNLHRKGLSTLDIMHLGGWSDLSMVLQYTRSITFEDCLVHYRQVTKG